MKTKKFDERQTQIRGKVFFHGFVTVIALLLTNAFLQSYGIVWASGFHQNALILMAAVTVVSIEAILRGVYFDSWRSRRIVTATFVILSLVQLHTLQGGAFIENNTLTDNGFSFAFTVMVVAITVIGIVKEFIERREKDE